jgi:hypothetical protein
MTTEVTGAKQAMRKLRLDALHERHVGLTPTLSGTLFEVAAACLGGQRHFCGV